ncbi:hypothetical protein OUZ56_000428 [Daphnia magna]|uniref:non-specific protein-tyrosine kinase n=1 Tax=Daphnia magna TaxID=35525 RepID=A0ABQ9ZZM6_9CRUS|nr:hypothetical protein OUZ56_000428 [Daphnia magna]
MSVGSASNNAELELLHQLLQDVELSQFSTRIIEELQISRVSHFDYVTTEDLMSIGMGKPAARRLLDTVKKRKGTLKKKLIQTFINQSANKDAKASLGKVPEAHHQQNSSSLTCLIKESELKIGTQLGDGSFGIVHKGEWNRADGVTIPVAVKVLKEDLVQHQAVYDDFVREVEAMHSLQHPCLIRLHGVVLSHPLMMVTELAPLGSLLDYLHKECSHTSICTLWQFASQVASGMASLESRRLLHRDLACRNIFLTSKTQAKIGDFGLLRPLPPGSDCYIMTEQRRVPFPWCAPESLKLRQFSLATDVWMFGITLWEMYTFGEEPWAGLSGHEILNRTDKKGERLIDPPAAPEVICNLMHRCWSANPADRPRFSEIVVELTSQSPVTVRCRGEDRQEPQWDVPVGATKLEVVDGDIIAVIDGRPDFFWWTGQNQRTSEIGIFPRCWTEPLRRRNGDDISVPLRHSFIHTGHGSSIGPSWGSPATIDEVYLRNPMEPMDILKMKDPTSSLESPRRVIGAVKTKTQFNYFRLNDDLVEPQDGASSPVANPKVKQPTSSTSHEEPLLIDLSPDTPVSSSAAVQTPQPFYQQLTEPLVALPDQNRLYANYPSLVPSGTPATAIDSVHSSSHYYSEVPEEPLTPTFTTPPCINTSPAQPIVTEEFKRKRDEAFDWLGQALGEMTLSKSVGSNPRNYQCVSPVSGQQPKPSAQRVYGFEDNFSVSMEPAIQTATVTSTSSQNGYHRIQQLQRQMQEQSKATRQPIYPKPGIWTDESSLSYSPSCPSTQQIYALPGPSRMSAVQTAHVRPFMVAINPSVLHVEDGHTSSLLNQVEISTPWASEAEIKQALVIHNGNVSEAIRFLQVEKLYRLGLCSKAVCVKALEATSWDLEKAASSLLDVV